MDKLIELLGEEKSLAKPRIHDENRSRLFKAQLEVSILEQEKLLLEHTKIQKTLGLAIGLSITVVISAVVAPSLIFAIEILQSITTVLGLFVGVALGIAGSFVGYWLSRSRRRMGARK